MLDVHVYTMGIPIAPKITLDAIFLQQKQIDAYRKAGRQHTGQIQEVTNSTSRRLEKI